MIKMIFYISLCRLSKQAMTLFPEHGVPVKGRDSGSVRDSNIEILDSPPWELFAMLGSGLKVHCSLHWLLRTWSLGGEFQGMFISLIKSGNHMRRLSSARYENREKFIFHGIQYTASRLLQTDDGGEVYD